MKIEVIVTVFFILTLSMSSANATPYDPFEETCAVNQASDFEITDSTRNDKLIGIRVRYPINCTRPNIKVPMILFSHGGGPDLNNNFHNDSHQKWAEAIVKAGYVVVHISHSLPDDISASELCDKFNQNYISTRRECTRRPGLGHTEAIQLMDVERPLDMLAVYQDLSNSTFGEQIKNALIDQNITIPGLDLRDIGLMGGSAGTIAPTILAGAKTKLDGINIYTLALDPDLVQTTPATLGYGRGLLPITSIPKAYVGISPQGSGFNGYFCGTQSGSVSSCPATDDNSFKDIDVPMFLATGSQDFLNTITPTNRRQAYDFINHAGAIHTKYFLYIHNDVGGLDSAGADHTFVNLDEYNFTPPSTLQYSSEAMIGGVIAFLDSRLKRPIRRNKARNFLSGSHITNRAAQDPDNGMNTEFLVMP